MKKTAIQFKPNIADKSSKQISTQNSESFVSES
jgi:hypothetical protein